MNKNVVLVFLCAIICSAKVWASTAEFRVAAFYPVSEKFRHIYGDVGPSYQLEASVPFCRPFEAWANLDWFSKARHYDRCCHSRARIINGSLGVKGSYCYCERYNFYLGLGLAVGGIYLHNHSSCIRENVSKCIVGGVLKTGVQITLYRKCYGTIFIDYLYQPVHFSRTIDVGGVKPGAGIGMYF